MWWILACTAPEKPAESPADSPTTDSQPDSRGDSPESPGPAFDDDLGFTNCNPIFPALTMQAPAASTAFLPSSNGWIAAAYAVDARGVPVHYTDGSWGSLNQKGAITTFWDHPTKNPTSTSTSEDRLWDLYPGLRTDGEGSWLVNVPVLEQGYLPGTGIIRLRQLVGDLEIETSYFAPFQAGGERDLVTVVTVKNVGSQAHSVELYLLQNAHVDGEGSAAGEDVSGGSSGILEKGSEGAMLHSPLGDPSHIAAAPGGNAANPWIRLDSDQALTDELISGDDVAVGFSWDFGSLGPGATATRGGILSFDSNPDALSGRLSSFIAGRSAAEVLAAEEADWAAWHALENPPASLSPAELALYQQSTAVLRMGQVRTPGSGYGQILASLPPGIWNISWPRDQSFATLALVAAGHLPEAEAAVRFTLGSDSGYYASYLGLSDYSVSVARYYGDGKEESDGATCPDGSDAGPNIELDDWGLFLQAWQATPGVQGESLVTVRAGVADPLLSLIQSNDLLTADSSIWERHWADCFPNGKKQFVWSSIQAAAGLKAAALDDVGYRDAADRLRSGLLRQKAEGGPVTVSDDGLCPILASAPEEICSFCGPLDASGVEIINQGLIRPESALAEGTLFALMSLRAPSGGFKRNDDGSGSTNPYPWYDDQEWLFIDLRMAMAMQKVAKATEDATLASSAEALLAHVTAIGTVNHGLIPELLSDGVYTPDDDADRWSPGVDGGLEAQGAHPMVGFGAGAYVLALEAMRE